MSHSLLAKGLWGLIDGTEVLAENASAQVETEFQRKSQRTFSMIVIAISIQQLYLVTTCECLRMCGMLLENTSNKRKKLFLKKRYFQTEMKEATSIEAHIKHIKEFTDKLAATGAHIDEEN